MAGEARTAAGAIGHELLAGNGITTDRPCKLARLPWRRWRQLAVGERIEFRFVSLRPIFVALPGTRRGIPGGVERRRIDLRPGGEFGKACESPQQRCGQRAGAYRQSYTALHRASPPVLPSALKTLHRFRPATISADSDLVLGGGDGAVVVDPGELERAAFIDPRGKLQKRIGRNGSFEVDAEHGFAVELARELVDDLARNGVAARVLAETRLHDVRKQGLDFDDLALLGVLRQLGAWRFGHDSLPKFQISRRSRRRSPSPASGGRRASHHWSWQ